jgi:hypothetical protein
MYHLDVLRRAALEIVTSDPGFANHTQRELEQYVLATGSNHAPAPHEDTRDLLYVYSANLLNAGGRGVDMHCFASMVCGVLAGQIEDDQIARVHSLPDLAAQCLAHLQTTGSRLLRKSDDTLYRQQLGDLANGLRPSRPLHRHLASVVGFIDLLHDKGYEGRAVNYHRSFKTHEARSKPGLTIVQHLDEISHLDGIGIATGLNFIKDSQSSGLDAGAGLQDLAQEPIAWAVKPDMHVLRLMLLASGRFEQTGLTFDELVHRPQNLVAREYRDLAPGADLFANPVLPPNRRRAERGLWTCVGDAQTWAAAHGAPPLEVDRLLYLIGSGRYIDGKELSSQQQRYMIFARALTTA